MFKCCTLTHTATHHYTHVHSHTSNTSNIIHTQAKHKQINIDWYRTYRNWHRS